MKLRLDSFSVKVILIIVWIGLALLLIPWRGRSPQPQPAFPRAIVQNETLCLIRDGKMISVENFTAGEPQFICADMTTDASSIDLTLIISPNDNSWLYVYTRSLDLKPGAILFPIDPALPPGKYRAKVTDVREILAEIYFDVNEK